MSQYSEMLGSFIRTGNFPMEANYIFPTYADLEEFYQDDTNKATLHKGLLKIVEDNGEGDQVLYWVSLVEDELQFTPLISGNSMEDIYEQLDDLQEKLEEEIQERIAADNDIYGTEDPDEIPEDLDSILDLSEAVTDLRDKAQNYLEQLKAIVGTEEDDIIAYLETLDYQNLTKISEALHHFLNTIDDEDPTINTLPELQEFLKGFEYTHNLYECFVDFWNAIEGDPLPNAQFRTLRGIQDFVETLSSVVKNRCDNLQTELDQTQVGVGLSGDGSFSPDQETYHLKNATSVMNALKILDSLINQAINNVNIQAGETNTTKVTIVRESDKTTIYADVKIAKETGNDIVAKDDGIYHRVDTEYADGILTVRVNGEIRQQHVLGLSMLVESAEYDPAQEAIIIIFKLQSGDTQKVVIPAGALISEWEVDNTIPDKVVELNKVRVVAGGADKLSADVRLSSDKYNILKKDGNTLLVDGRADNIVYDGDITVKSKLDQLQTSNESQDSSISKLVEDLATETHNREIAEQDIKNEADKLKARVEVNETNISNLQSQTSTLESGLQQEINDRTLADQDLQNKIDSLNTRVDNNDSKTQAVQDGLIEVNNKLEQEIKDRIAEETRATAVETDLQNQINTANTNIQQNTDNISTLQDGLRSEIDRATAEEQAIKDLIRDTEHIYNGTKSIHFDKQGNVVTADVKIAAGDSNIIKVDNTAEGIYATVDIGYNALENKIWLITSGGTTKEVQLSEGHVIDDIYYDVNEKSLIIVFTANGIQKTTKFPVADLFNDWIVVNPTENSAIELTKVHNVKDPSSNDTPDTLSARLLIADVESNAAQIIGNGLFVSNKETANNTKAIEELQTKQSDLESSLSSEIDRAKTAESELNTNLQLEVTRATGKEELLDQKIDSTKSDLTIKIDANSTKITELDSYTRGELAKKLESVQLIKNDDLSYTILVDGTSIGVINIPKDQFLQSVSLNGNVLHFVFVTTDGYSTTDIDFTQVLKDALESTIGDVSSIKTLLDQTVQNLNDEIIRATHREDLLEQSLNNVQNQVSNNATTISSLQESINNIKLKDVEQDSSIAGLAEKTTKLETDLNTTNAALGQKVNSVEVQKIDDLNYLVLVDGISAGTISIPKDKYLISVDLIGSILRFVFDRGNSESAITDIDLEPILKGLDSSTTSIQEALTQLTIKVNEEISRAKSEESRIESKLDSEIVRATQQEQFTADELHDHIHDYNNPHKVTASQLGVYTKDVMDEMLRDLNESNSSNFKDIQNELSQVSQDLNNHVNNTSNPHNVTKEQVGLGKVDNTTDLEKPISVAVQEALNAIYLYIQDNYAKSDDFNNHIHDYTNPHKVTQDQVGLDKVDNTSDLDKPISKATQEALDKKSDIDHTHNVTDIVDLNELAVVEGVISSILELPDSPANHEKWLLMTPSGSGTYKYVEYEYDAPNDIWKQKILEEGTIASVKDENAWKLNSSGIERILDASDYKYFYNKVYDETKDLIEDIDWEEDDTADTNGMIRLKITYKTKYGNPDSEGANEVTNPYQAKAVKYIDIEKSRFLANAFSRPATQDDVNKGYGSQVGEPILVLVFTTGDYVGIPLKEMVNIYDEIDTDSINLDVSDWTGTPSTSYKISANLNIAATKGQEDAISLHINSTSNDKGIYATLHTQNTNSISINPSTGTSGQKYLTANLNIDNALNNVNDVLLSISSSGLSAQIVIGDYD